MATLDRFHCIHAQRHQHLWCFHCYIFKEGLHGLVFALSYNPVPRRL